MPSESPLEGMILLCSFLEVHGHSGGDSHRTRVVSDLKGDRARQNLAKRAWQSSWEGMGVDAGRGYRRP